MARSKSRLQPIKNMWADVKKSIRERKKRPSYIAELERHIKKSWKEISIHTIENLVDNMLQRIWAVIEANGGLTKY